MQNQGPGELKGKIDIHEVQDPVGGMVVGWPRPLE